MTRILRSDLERYWPETRFRRRKRLGDELGLSFILPGEIGQNVAVLNQIKRFAEVPNKLEAYIFVADRNSESKTNGTFAV